MNISSIYKLGFLSLTVIFLGGLTGCVQQAVVSSHHRVAVVEPILITSNLAYYERYGYPAGYQKRYSTNHVSPYYSAPPPRPIVVKKVKVIHAQPVYRDHHRYVSKPVYVKPHRPAATRYIKENSHKHHVSKESRPHNKGGNREPVNHHKKPRSEPHKPSHKMTPKSEHRGLIDAVNQAKQHR